jgi:hypothetical protein
VKIYIANALVGVFGALQGPAFAASIPNLVPKVSHVLPHQNHTDIM